MTNHQTTNLPTTTTTMKTEIKNDEPKEIRKVVSKQKVAVRESLNETFDLILFEDYIKAKNSPFVIGFGDIGITPIITSNSLIEQLDLPYIGVLLNKEAAPASVITGGQAMHPIRIFGDERLIVIVSDSKTEAKLATKLVNAIVKVLPYFNSTKVFCCEGAPTETTEKIEKRELQFVTTSTEISESLMEMEHKPLQEAVIAGISGGILAECTAQFSEHDFDTCIFLAPTCSFYPDIWASVLIMQTMSTLLSFNTDTSTLEKNAKKLEDKAQELMGIHSSTKSMNQSLYM